MKKNNSFEIYYEYQTTARGAITEKELKYRFRKISSYYKFLLKNKIPNNKEISILDIPCGYGNILYFLRSQGYTRVRGIDIDPKQIKLAKMLNLNAIEADCLKFLESSNEFFDCIFSVDFLEHLDKDSALYFLKLCYRKLKKDGVLIIRTPCANGFFGAHDRYNDLTHVWSMTSIVLKCILEITGFKKIELLDERPYPNNVLNFLRTLGYFPVKYFISILLLFLNLSPPKIWSRSMWAIAKKSV